MPDTGTGAKLVCGVAAAPLLAVASVLMILGGAGASASPSSAVCGGGGTGQSIDGVRLDAEQMGNTHTIVSVVAGRHLPMYAADVAVDTAYTESTLRNDSTQTDHDSEGLFQQRVSIYTAAVATDPVKATDAFLDRLVRAANWLANPVGGDAQSVQSSQHPERYQPNAALAAALVGQFWPAAAAAAGPAPTTPETGVSATGVSATGVPATGVPATGVSATGVSATGVSATGVPATGVPATGVPATGVPATGVPTSGVPASGSAAPALGTGPAICAGAGGAVATGGTVAGKIVGPTGNNIAGTTRMPAGFTLSGSVQGNGAVRFALAQLGKPYVFGAAGPNAYDCSGLTMAAWAAAGVALPHLAAGQSSDGTAEPNDLSQAVSGDLVLIPGSDGTSAAPGHVGMVAGYVEDHNARHLFVIQAPETGVPVELTQATEWSGQIVDVRHIA